MTACRLTVIGRTHSHRPIQRVRREIQVGHIRVTDGHDVERRTTAIEDSKPAAASDLVDDGVELVEDGLNRLRYLQQLTIFDRVHIFLEMYTFLRNANILDFDEF